MKNLLKIAILVTLLIATIANFEIQTAKAITTADESEDLDFDTNDQNIGQVAACGIYNIYATDTKIIFYDSGGLAKEWPIARASAYAWSKYGSSTTKIVAVNSTHLLVSALYYSTASSTDATSSCTVKWDIFLLNVASLAYTTIHSGSSEYGGYVSNWWSTTHKDDYYSHAIIKIGSNVYGVATSGHTNTVTYKSFVAQIYPTFSMKGGSATDEYFMGPTICIPDETSTDNFYVLTSHGYNTSRCDIYKIGISAGTITHIGTSGLDRTWGDLYDSSTASGSSDPNEQKAYTSYGGYNYEIDAYANYYYHVWYITPYFHTGDSGGQLCGTILTFNDTYIGQDVSQIGCAGPTVWVPVMSIYKASDITTCDAFGWESNTLADGLYESEYIGPDFQIWSMYWQLDDLTTISPSVTATTDAGAGFTVGQFQLKTHYYAGEDGGGIMIGTWNIIIYTDRNNGLAIIDTYGSVMQSFSYGHGLSPAWLNTITDPSGPYLVATNQVYDYTGSLTANGVANTAGIVDVYLYSNSSNAWLKMRSYTLSDGVFAFKIVFFDSLVNAAIGEKIQGVFDSSTDIGVQEQDGYMVIAIVVRATSHSYTYTQQESYITTGAQWNSGIEPMPTEPVDPWGPEPANVLVTSTQLTGYIIPLFTFAALPLIFAGMAGYAGLIAGFGIALVVNVLAGTIPFWGIFICVIGLFVLLFIGGGKKA